MLCFRQTDVKIKIIAESYNITLYVTLQTLKSFPPTEAT